MPSAYLIVKLVHIVSATLLFGTGLGTAFFMFTAWRSGNAEALHVTSRHVVVADWLFTLPAVIVQLGTGLWLTDYLRIPWRSAWFAMAMGGFVVIGLCWVPVVLLQIRIRDLARTGHAANGPRVAALMRFWVALGIPAFALTLGLFVLMVLKPGLG